MNKPHYERSETFSNDVIIDIYSDGHCQVLYMGIFVAKVIDIDAARQYCKSGLYLL